MNPATRGGLMKFPLVRRERFFLSFFFFLLHFWIEFSGQWCTFDSSVNFAAQWCKNHPFNFFLFLPRRHLISSASENVFINSQRPLLLSGILIFRPEDNVCCDTASLGIAVFYHSFQINTENQILKCFICVGNDCALLHKELLPFSARWGFYFIDYFKISPARCITPVYLKLEAIKPDLCWPLLWSEQLEAFDSMMTPAVLLLYLTFWHQAWHSCATLAQC